MSLKVLLYLQLHQPQRINKLNLFDFKNDVAKEELEKRYFNKNLNEEIFNRVLKKSYFPFLKKLTELEVAFNLGVSGVLLEQFTLKQIDLIKSVVPLQYVDFFRETSHHSLASLYDLDEFRDQIKEHTRLIHQHFGKQPLSFRNTELITFKGLQNHILQKDYILSEEVAGKQPAYLLKRNNQLSDAIGFKLESTANNIDQYVGNILKEEQEIIVLGVDFETFGEHYDIELSTTFIESFVREFKKRGGEFVGLSDLPTLTMQDFDKELNFKEIKSWADKDKDDSAWRGNEMQCSSLTRLYNLREAVLSTQSKDVLDIWRKLQTSDHFYYMSNKKDDDGSVHEYFSPFNTPHDAFVYYSNILTDFELNLASY